MKEEHSSTCRTVGGVFVLDRMTGTCRLCGQKVCASLLERVDELEDQVGRLARVAAVVDSSLRMLLDIIQTLPGAPPRTPPGREAPAK
ncbi:hypothetical protein LCGC14_1586720 [marine sediment metagenome]|uniref:Uncharacterized protein n=2 Tax=marine sediment metagenome TaxID=412755 RepID=A0A0F9J1D3_9ZZZZ